VSVISAVEYARNSKELLLLPELAISCDGPVRSVALFSMRPVTELGNQTVLLSASSRTSVGLLELLCKDVWKIAPKFAQARAEAQDLDALAALPHEAVLVIGDAALALAARGTYPHRYDLGAEWKQWTGLPFVFAVWAARRSADPAAVRRGHDALLASRAWGLAHLELLAEDAAGRAGVPLAACREYLGGLDYAFTYKHLAGLTDFFRRLAAEGLVPDGSLQFLQVA
jgi:chorismate dehydratase